jgi:outer membrane receptor for ferrienterochelin and colicin
MMRVKIQANLHIRCISLLIIIIFIFHVKSVFSASIDSSNNNVNISIPAQLTKDSLLSLAIQYKVQIMFSPKVVGELLSPEVSGSLSVHDAIQSVIDTNPLTLIRLSEKSYIIQRKKAVIAKKRAAKPKVTLNKSKKKHVKKIERISVTGSHIKGSESSEHVPTRILDKTFILSAGAVNGEELLRKIPQIGEISFRNERAIGGINDARGDVSSINLRGIGTGNTLILLNGRRLVQHPGTQTENFIPVNTVNINTLPIKSLDRIEVLLGGGTALYGSDAVAGVVNYIIDNERPKNEFSVNYGGDPTTNFDQLNIAAYKTFTFDRYNSYLNASLNYYRRSGIMANELVNSKSEDLRQASQLPSDFVSNSQLDNRSTFTPWATFQHPSSGLVHIQPATLGNCSLTISESVCAAAGELPTELKFDRSAYRSLTSDVERLNFHGYFSRLLKSDIELFAETYLYFAKTGRTREQAPNLNIQRFTIAKNAAYNPFNEDIILQRYRAIDTGLRNIVVDNQSNRILLGATGLWKDWDWESALLYSNAKTIDTAHNRINASAFQQTINETKPLLAYDLFNGGSIEFPNTIDTTINAQSVIDNFLVDVTRVSTTSLTQFDVKWSNPQVYALKHGNIEVAAGLEFRRETFSDNRDELLDGSTPFIDNETGVLLSKSNVLGSSHTLDAVGGRNIASSYFDSYLPLFKNTSAQVAFRYENYSDIGNVSKVKAAISSKINEYIQLRTSWANGFRAPNLPQIAEKGLSRFNFLYDPVIDSIYGISEVRLGNAKLKSENNINVSFGGTFNIAKTIYLSLDWWQIKQRDVIGIIPASTLLLYDGLLNSRGENSSNITRNEFGNVSLITNQYTNLNSRKMAGIDYNASFQYESNIGLISAKLNIAQLLEYQQGADPISAELLREKELGNPNIPANTIVTTVGDLLNINGRPSWRVNYALSWNIDNIGAGFTYNYTSKFKDRSVQNTDGDLLPIDDYHTYGAYLSYELLNETSKTKILLGINNITNKLPPVADENFGYFSTVHSSSGRYIYLDLSIKI